MSKIIDKIFGIHAPNNQKDLEEVVRLREKAIFKSGIVGIVVNFLLAGVKILLGLGAGVVSLTADGVNNFFDAASSIVAVVSARASAKEADEEHPFGHGRAEYVSALIVAFIIVIVGFELAKASFGRLISGRVPVIGFLEISVMAVAVVVKLVMIIYNRRLEVLFDSHVNRAVASDSLNDALGGVIIIIAFIGMRWISFPLEALAGMILSGYIMYSGYSIAKDMVAMLLGKGPSREILDGIYKIIETEPMVEGVHDCHIHDYGIGGHTGSLHVEIDSRWSLVEAHNAIDSLEEKIMEELSVLVTIHIDPIERE